MKSDINPADHDVVIWLSDPRYPHNVGSAIRAASIFTERPLVVWSGQRVIDPTVESGIRLIGQKSRLPREERMKEYTSVVFHNITARDQFQITDLADFTPVCVEVDPTAESLPTFEHPERPVYIFGPEDGSVPTGIRHICHRFVTIPSKSCLNLAAAVNVVLYDRVSKQ